jgi:hypothetical protein
VETNEQKTVVSITYKTFDEFFKKAVLGEQFKHGFIFRGESTKGRKLLPSALREENYDKVFLNLDPDVRKLATAEYQKQIKKVKTKMLSLKLPFMEESLKSELYQAGAELEWLKVFYRIANNCGLKIPYVEEFSENYLRAYGENINGFLSVHGDGEVSWLPKELGQLAALAQHYGVPTRLIDWSQDIFVALYFAVRGAIKKGLDDRNANWENDSIVIWALYSHEVQGLREYKDEIPLVLVVPPYSDNPNLRAQKGVLSYWERKVTSVSWDTDTRIFSIQYTDRTPLDELLVNYTNENNNTKKTLLYKFEIPVTQCILAYNTLKKLGYTAPRLFPGYEGIEREIREDLMAVEVGLKRKLVGRRRSIRINSIDMP